MRRFYRSDKMRNTPGVGLGLNLVAGLWWAEYVAALALLVFIVREAGEAIEAARGGETD